MPVARPVDGQVGDPVGPDQWFKSLPIITRYWFGATIIVTLSANFQIISPMQIVYIWESVKTNFELWRLITPFCYAGAFEFNTLISVYMLVSFSKQYEVGGPFNTGAGGGTADYAFCILFGMVLILATYHVVPFKLSPVFSRNLIYYILYVWSKRHPTQQANIWGFPVAASQLPFAYLALSVFMGGSYIDMIHGMVVGHIYYFLADVIPLVYGKDVLTTPQILIDYFGVGMFEPAAAPVQRPPRVAAAGGGAGQRLGGGGHAWGGGGRRLGDS